MDTTTPASAAAAASAAEADRPAPFERARGKFGFGCMRLPQLEDKTVDLAAFTEMVDAFLDGGLNYFDTARPYLSGNSEPALAAALTSRHDRSEFVLADKLSPSSFERAEEVRPLIEDQLRTCGVDYFDYYLMHSQGMGNYPKYRECCAYEQAFEARDAGLVRHVGLSFHSSAAFLDQILAENPDIEFVQLQINYLDYESGVIQSRLCLETARAHGKPVIVMEPVKGGRLVNLPPEAVDALAAAGPGSPASYALRFAAGLPGVEMVLSGMGSMDMVRDNVATFSPFTPLSEAELAAVERATEALRGQNVIGCTACRYCVDGCPKKINIPDLFSCLNAKRAYNEDSAGFYYKSVHTGHGHGLASECVGCGKCEAACPQHLPIRELLKDVAAEFETEQAS